MTCGPTKRGLLLFVLAAVAMRVASAADALDFPNAALRIEVATPAPQQFLPVELSKLGAPIFLFGPPFFGGSVRVISGTSILKYRPPSPNLDAPGPGYREQLQRLYGP